MCTIGPSALIFTRLEAASRQEPGCLMYIVHRHKDSRATIFIYEQYKDDKSLDEHRASTHFRQYAVGGLYQLMRERTVENLTAVV